MIAISALRQLPLPERLQLVEDLWDSIAEDQDSLPDPPQVVEELRRRKASLSNNPASAISWDKAKDRIRSRHG